MPEGQQLETVESEAGPPFIGLVQVHTLVPSNNELGVLGRVGQGGAAQRAAVGTEL